MPVRIPDEEQNLLDNLSTPEAAKAIVVDLYKDIAYRCTVIAAAPFQLRTLNGEDYLVTKAFITVTSGVQSVVGVRDGLKSITGMPTTDCTPEVTVINALVTK